MTRKYLQTHQCNPTSGQKAGVGEGTAALAATSAGMKPYVAVTLLGNLIGGALVLTG
jgi:hypothetical protein